jgi:hypothetical protein
MGIRDIPDDIWCQVGYIFSYDLDKVRLWFSTANPLLGGVSPMWMLEHGREEKLRRFIDLSVGENEMG